MSIVKYFTFFLFLFLFSASIFGLNFDIENIEELSIYDIGLDRYSLEAEGVLSISNPSNSSTLFDIRLEVELYDLLGLQLKNISNLKDIELQGDVIIIRNLNPNSTINLSYKIFGLTTENISSKIENKSLFEYFLKSRSALTNVLVNLGKGELVNSNTLNEREITTDFKNPTDFSLHLNRIEIFKTTVDDAFFEEGDIIWERENISILPFKDVFFSFKDRNSSENSVYWVRQKFSVENNLEVSVTTFLKKDFRNRGGGSGGGGRSKDLEDGENLELPFFGSGALIKKTTDKTIIRNGESVKVTIRIINSGYGTLENLSVIDVVPKNYKIKNINKAVKVKDGKIIYIIESLAPYSTEVLEYEISSEDIVSQVTFLPPAKLIRDDDEISSKGVLLVGERLSEAKIFVQKEIKSFDENFFEVTLKVKNVQNSIIENLIISQYIPDDVLIKQISKVFRKRGEWVIKTLGPNELWEVSFLVEKSSDNEIIYSLPNVFGVGETQVLGTVISSSELSETIIQSPDTIEKAGIVLAVGLLVFYLLF